MTTSNWTQPWCFSTRRADKSWFTTFSTFKMYSIETIFLFIFSRLSFWKITVPSFWCCSSIICMRSTRVATLCTVHQDPWTKCQTWLSETTGGRHLRWITPLLTSTKIWPWMTFKRVLIRQELIWGRVNLLTKARVKNSPSSQTTVTLWASSKRRTVWTSALRLDRRYPMAHRRVF